METFLTYISSKLNLDNALVNKEYANFLMYNKMKKTELVIVCEEKDILYKSMTKTQIVSNIMNDVKKEQGTKAGCKKASNDLISKIKSEIKPQEIRKNSFGNFEHTETRFVFNKTTKEVIGKQLDNGSVQTLTKKCIETCKQYNFKYEIPDNLNSRDDIKTTKDKELLDGFDEKDLLGGDDDDEEDDE